jgi:hypothetical protein
MYFKEKRVAQVSDDGNQAKAKRSGEKRKGRKLNPYVGSRGQKAFADMK